MLRQRASGRETQYTQDDNTFNKFSLFKAINTSYLEKINLSARNTTVLRISPTDSSMKAPRTWLILSASPATICRAEEKRNLYPTNIYLCVFSNIDQEQKEITIVTIYYYHFNIGKELKQKSYL